MSSILILDDHPLLAQGLAHALRAEGFEVHISNDPDIELAKALALVHRPVLALVDLHFDGALRGIDLVYALAPTVPVLVLTGLDERSVLGRCLKAGASGVASKAQSFDHLYERILRALRGEAVHSLREREELLDAAAASTRDETDRWSAFDVLSPREQEVLELLARGLSAERIAEQIYVSLATVRTHIQSVLRKLDVSSQVAAVARVRETGWSLDRQLTSTS